MLIQLIIYRPIFLISYNASFQHEHLSFKNPRLDCKTKFIILYLKRQDPAIETERLNLDVRNRTICWQNADPATTILREGHNPLDYIL